MAIDRDKLIENLVAEMHANVPYADNRADISIQQTDNESSEIQDVIAQVRARNGDVKWIDEGVIQVYTNNKVSLDHIIDYLDENDNVYGYDVAFMEVGLNGVNRDVTDEVEFEDVRDMNNFFFKILIVMDPNVVMFDPVYVDIDDVTGRSPYFDAYDDDFDYGDDFDYVDEYIYENLSHVKEFISWKGDLNETYILFEKKDGGAEMHLIPPETTGDDEYFNINKFNVDAAENHGTEKMFQDMGFTMTNRSKNKEIDYEMHGEPEDVIVYDIENNDKDGKEILVREMVDVITEATIHSDYKTITEIVKKTKWNSKGKKRIKMQCRPGYKYVQDRRTCVKISGSDMMDMKRRHIRANRTKKQAGRGALNRKIKMYRKAMRFRNAAGQRDTPMVR